MANNGNNGFYFPCIFRDWEAIRNTVTPEQGWRLFLRCLDYAQGREPEPEPDPVITAFFKLISGGIDRSILSFDERRRKNRYARYCGIVKNSGKNPLSYEQWLTDVDGRQPSTADVDNNIHINSQIKNKYSDSTPSTGVDGEAQAQSFNSSKKRSLMYWEVDIPEVFRGRFETEEAYYAWAENHRDEISSICEEVTNRAL